MTNRRKTRSEQEYEAWLVELAHCDDWPDYPGIASLEEVWQLQSKMFASPSEEMEFHSDDEFRKHLYDSESPFVAAMKAIASGYYPPPEVALALLTRFNNYLESAGEMDLESALIGVKRVRTGSYSRRSFTKNQPLVWAREIGKDIADNGAPAIQAATNLVEKYGLDIEPETVLRRIRNDPHSYFELNMTVGYARLRMMMRNQ